MGARIILFTGKGGVGKTTSAAGTATLAARSGQRTLVLSTDAAHSLGDAFGLGVGPEPTEVAPDLWVQQVDAQRRFERSWSEIQGYLVSVLDAAGVDPITAEELTVIPGAEEVLALLELRSHAVSGRWDVIVVDCAPTAETLRLLAYRGLTAIEKYGQPGPEGSLTKWLWSETNQELTQFAVDVLGFDALEAGSAWAYELLRARGNTIEGGTTEILKNIVAERVLGLPRLKVAA